MKITRNNITLEMETLEIQRKEKKGQKYIGLSFENDKNIQEKKDWLGEEIINNALNTFINGKFQMFNEQAWKTAFKAHPKEDEKEQRKCVFEKEFISIVEKWSARQESKDAMQKRFVEISMEYMKETDEEKKKALGEEMTELAKKLSEK